MKKTTDVIFRLLKKKASGQLSNEETLKLENLAAEFPEAHAIAKQHFELDEELQTLEKADEKISVQENIMQIIRAQKASANPFLQPKLPRLAPITRFYLAASVAAGILLGLVLGKMIFSEAVDLNIENISGSMLSNQKTEISYASGNSSIKMIPVKADNFWYLNFIIDTHDELETQIHFDAESLSVVKAAYIYNQGPELFNLNSGNLQFAARGRVSFQLILENNASELNKIKLKISRNQSILIDREILLN